MALRCRKLFVLDAVFWCIPSLSPFSQDNLADKRQA